MVDCVLVQKIKQYKVAAKFNIHTQTVRKWVKRFKKEGELGLENRSSRRHSHPNATPPEKVKEIINMRKEGKMTGDHFARELNITQRTVCRHLIEVKLYRQKDIEPRDKDPPQRYVYEAPGDMIHLDIKTLENFNEEGIRDEEARNRHKSANKAAGTQCMHVVADDQSRYATVSVLEDETAKSVTKHLIETFQHYPSKGIAVKRVFN